jgi:hypothetical protein
MEELHREMVNIPALLTVVPLGRSMANMCEESWRTFRRMV